MKWWPFIFLFFLFIISLFPLVLLMLTPNPIDEYLRATCSTTNKLSFRPSSTLEELTTIISAPNAPFSRDSFRIYIHDTDNLYLVVDDDEELGRKLNDRSQALKATHIPQAQPTRLPQTIYYTVVNLPVWRYASSIADHIEEVGDLERHNVAGSGIEAEVQSIYTYLSNDRKCPKDDSN
jgi:hypothetical protein